MMKKGIKIALLSVLGLVIVTGVLVWMERYQPRRPEQNRTPAVFLPREKALILKK